MKKTIKLLSVLLGIILALTPILSLTASADGTTTDTTTEKGKLAITEIYAGAEGDTDYQYVEVVNVSNTTIDLSEYYLYRYTQKGADIDTWDLIRTQYLLGHSYTLPTIIRIQLANTETLLQPGEVAVLWLRVNTSLTLSDFTTKFSNAKNVKIVEDAFNEYKDGINYNGITCDPVFSYPQGANYVLPCSNGLTLLDLVHKDAEFLVGGVATKAGDETFDIVQQKNTNDDNSYKTTNLASRHAAADCSALIYSNGTTETANLSHNYYGYLNVDKYYAKCAAEETPAVADTNQWTKTSIDKYVESNVGLTYEISSFVSGKPGANGMGLKLYSNKTGTTPTSAYFVDDGTKTTVTPGTLLDGQFGSNSIQVLGYQTKDNDMRIVASFEADALMANAVGFEITATFADSSTKSLTKNCYTVYSALGGSAIVNGTGVTPLDSDYLATVGTHDYYVALTIEDIDADVTFTVKPYVLNGTLKVYGQTATIEYTATQANA